MHVQMFHFIGTECLVVGGGGGESLSYLSELPFVNKVDIKNRPGELSTREKLFLLQKKTTGGSTGQPVSLLKTRSAMGFELAAMWRGYSWAGIEVNDRQARFWGVPIYFKDKMKGKAIDFVCNRKRFSAFRFSEEDLYNYTLSLAKFKPKYLYGYVSMLCEYAKFLEKNKISEKLDKIEAIITTSEVLYPNQRELLQHVFKAEVFNEYGCGEVGTIAHECEFGSMHISAENLIVEIVNNDVVCPVGVPGEIVVTELNNNAMPLIRYKLGDFGVLTGEKCNCGRNLPVIDKIYGRQYDVVVNKQGRKFHGEYFMYIFEETKKRNMGIEQFQVVQKSTNQFVIKIIPSGEYGTLCEEFIKNKIAEGFGDDTKVDFLIVEKIERENSGKMRLIIAKD